jgi:hypothetical protein
LHEHDLPPFSHGLNGWFMAYVRRYLRRHFHALRLLRGEPPGPDHPDLAGQPVIFYALCVYTHLVGVWDGLNVGLAWAYVAIRIVHSLIQVTTNFVPLRFAVFNLGSIVLAIIAVRNVLGLFGI